MDSAQAGILAETGGLGQWDEAVVGRGSSVVKELFGFRWDVPLDASKTLTAEFAENSRREPEDIAYRRSSYWSPMRTFAPAISRWQLSIKLSSVSR